MALLWPRRCAIRGGFFSLGSQTAAKREKRSKWASFLPLTSVCVVPREPLIARLLRTLAKVARVSAACFPDSSNNPSPAPLRKFPHPLPSTQIIESTWSFVLKPQRHPILLKLYFSKSLMVCLRIAPRRNHQSEANTPHCVGKKMQRNWSNVKIA